MAGSASATAARDPFGVRGSVTSGGDSFSIYSLPTLKTQGVADIDHLPFVVRILLENLLRYAGTEFATADDVTKLANWDPARPLDVELAFLPARVGAPGLHRRSLRRRSGRNAVGGGAHGRRYGQDQPAGSGRSGHRPLGPGRQLRHNDGLRPTMSNWNTSATASGTTSCAGHRIDEELPRRAPRHRHRPPGQSRVSGQRRRDTRYRWRDVRLPGHAGRHRLAIRP